MNSPFKNTTLLFVAIIIVALGLLIGYAVKCGEYKAAGSSSVKFELLRKTSLDKSPSPWPSDLPPKRHFALSLSNMGPAVDFGNERLNLMPNSKELTLTWTLQRIENTTFFFGAGSWYNKNVLFTWAFADNNPQTRFSFEFTDELPDTDELRLQWALPSDATFLDNSTPDHFASLSAFQLRAFHHNIVGSNGNYYSLSLSTASPDNNYLDFLWKLCGDNRVGTFTLTFADKEVSQTALLTPLPSQRASKNIIPLFFFPSVDQVHRNTVARTSDDIVSQIRALLYGHSDIQDPRYGTSGILNTSMAVTFLLPPEMDANAIRSQLEIPSRIQILTSSEWDHGTTTIASVNSCAPQIKFSLNAPTSDDSLIPSTILQLHNIPHFDEVADALDPASLDSAKSDKFVGRAILVSRNPLIEETRQSLLAPARYGAWQVSKSFAKFLATIGESYKASENSATPYATLRNYYQRSNALLVETWYRPDGFEIVNLQQVGKPNEVTKLFLNTDIDGKLSGEALARDGGRPYITLPSDGKPVSLKYVDTAASRWPKAVSWEVKSR